MAYCKKCGKELNENVQFCSACGAPILADSTDTLNDQTVQNRSRNDFVSNYLGFIITAFVFLVVLILAMTGESFGSSVNMNNLFVRFIMLSSISFAVVLSTRAKGPDLSIGAVLALSSVIIAQTMQDSDSWVMGLILALVVCGIIGLINGVITVFVRIPAVITTLVMSAIVRACCYAISDASQIVVDLNIRALNAGFFILIITFIIAFLLILLTKLGVPLHQRNSKSASKSKVTFVLAYVASSVIAVFVGMLMMLRLSSGIPTIGNGYEIFILFVFACVISSRVIDNKFAPVLYAMVPALVWTIYDNALILHAINPFTTMILEGALTLIFLVVAFISRKDIFRQTMPLYTIDNHGTGLDCQQ